MKAKKIKLLLNKSIIAKSLLMAFVFGLISVSAFAQLNPQPALTYNGQYDIKMIAAPVLQSVWVKTQSPLDILSVLTDQEMRQCGKYLSLNNEVSGETGEGGNSVKLTSNLNSKAQPFVPPGAIGMSTIYADCDDDMTTFQSSAAFLDFGSDMGCTSVEAAYLYWFGDNSSNTTTYAAYPGIPTLRSHGGGATGTSSGYNTVKFKAPNEVAYSTVTADRTLNSVGTYVCFSDVTSLVQGKPGGLYWVANVKNTGVDGGGGSRGGWNLVVIFKPPNCPPRVIKFWDGFLDTAGGTNITLNFAAGEVPKSGNSVSYLGYTTIDAEDDEGILVDAGITVTPANSGVRFVSSPGGTTQYINPFITDQPGVDVYDNAGVLHTDVRCGMASSRISTYDPETDLNGNEVIRLPAIRNTLGFGCNHIKLPAGSMVPNATSAQMTIPDEQNGGLSAYMVYMAIETLQPDLRLYLRAEQATTAPAGTMTYVLTVENIGPLTSQSGAYITDEIIKSLDFAGNIQYLDKDGASFTPPTAALIENQGADVDEKVTFYLPSIAAGNGSTASDSVRIKFDVTVQPLSRTDIWSYGCNRTIYNRATIVFKADDGSDLIGGSNASAGCSGLGSYYNTPIVDATLDAQYTATHTLEDDLTDEVNAAEGASSHLYIIPTIQGYLTQQLTTLGLPVGDVPLYEIYNEEGGLVKSSDYFTQEDPSQEYNAIADLGDGCIEQFEYTITVAAVPKFDPNITVVQPDFPGDPSGGFSVRAYDGTPGYSITVQDGTGATVFYSNSTSADLDAGVPPGKTFNIEGLPAGNYTFFIGDQGVIPISGGVTITDKSPLSLTISGPTQVCEGSAATLTANQSGRLAGDPTLEYVWYESPDNVNWTKLPVITNVLTRTPTDPTTYYEAYVCDGAIFASADHQVDALSTPVVRVEPRDSGCYEFNLVDVRYEQLNTDLLSTDYTVTLHTANPSSATDNRFIIPTSQYNIKKKQDVWVRLSVNDFCYDTDKGNIYIKSMEECYPITIPDFFSPDGDGFNDRWEIEGLEGYNNPEILVYDRFGKVVFKGGKEDLIEPNGWDGTYLGNPLPSADYWYQMNFLEIKPKVGHFTLKRKKE